MSAKHSWAFFGRVFSKDSLVLSVSLSHAKSAMGMRYWYQSPLLATGTRVGPPAAARRLPPKLNMLESKGKAEEKEAPPSPPGSVTVPAAGGGVGSLDDASLLASGGGVDCFGGGVGGAVVGGVGVGSVGVGALGGGVAAVAGLPPAPPVTGSAPQ
jgi:hypothetical protein